MTVKVVFPKWSSKRTVVRGPKGFPFASAGRAASSSAKNSGGCSRASMVMTRRDGFTISRNSPSRGYSSPSGERITIRYRPPGRTSISQTGFVKPFGPHHCATCFGSVQASNTRSRGASKVRVSTKSRSVAAILGRCSASFSSVDFPPSTAPKSRMTLSRASADVKTMRSVTRVPPASGSNVMNAWNAAPGPPSRRPEFLYASRRGFSTSVYTVWFG